MPKIVVYETEGDDLEVTEFKRDLKGGPQPVLERKNIRGRALRGKDMRREVEDHAKKVRP